MQGETRQAEEGLETQELRQAVATLQRQLSQAKAKTAELVEAVHHAAKDAAVILGNPPAVLRPPRDRRGKQPEVAVLLVSDWHFGKKTESFDIAVATERVKRLAEKVEQMTWIERADHPVRDIHVLCNGDMAENLGIFPGQPYEVDAGLFEQIFAASGALHELLRAMLGVFPSVHIWQQAGNHGRIGKRGDMPRRDNIDRMIYRIVQDRMSNSNGRLTWHPSDTWYSIVEIGKYRALLLHGDQIRSFGGAIPAFGITRKVNAWATGVLPDFADCYMSHFHQPLVLPIANGRGRTFVNPALESDSGYAKEFVAATGTPGQLLKFVDPDKGRVTTERVLWLDD